VIKYIIQQIRRSALTNTFFCLLLALSGALLCISAGLWYSAHKALLDIDKNVTTIAIPNAFAIKQYAKRDIKESGITEYETESGMVTLEELGEAAFLEAASPYFEMEILETIRDSVYESDLLWKDNRRVFGAYSPGIATVPMQAMGLGMAREIASVLPQSNAAFVVTCDGTKPEYWLDWREEADGTVTYFLIRYTFAVFTVEEAIYLHSAYEVPRGISIYLYYMPSDSSSPVEPGKRYVVMGGIEPGGAWPRLRVDVRNIESVITEVGSMDTIAELRNSVQMRLIDYYGLTEDDLPMEIVSYIYEDEPGSMNFGYTLFELEGSLDDAIASGVNERMRKELDAVGISYNSFTVLTTNDANSILRFNQTINILEDGRLFNAFETENGSRVCLVSKQLAALHGLAVGDTLPLRMYHTVLREVKRTFQTSENGASVTRTFWIPSLYYSDLEISETIDYTITGILNILSLDSGDYAISTNTIIIPDKSFEGVAGQPAEGVTVPRHTPLLDDGVIVPNGRVDEVKAIINGVNQGYSNLFRFYDQGYETLKKALSNLRFGMSWIAAISAASWTAVGFLFIMFFVSRKRQEALVLYAIGVSRSRRFQWIFIQSAALIVISLGITLAVSLPLYGDILSATGAAAEAFTVSFRDLTLSNAAEVGVRRGMPLDMSVPALLVTAAASTVILLVISGVMSAKSAVFKSQVPARKDS